MRSKIALFIGFTFLISCKNDSKPAANVSVNPFDTTYNSAQNQTQTLSEADRTALLSAKGKRAQSIDFQTISAYFDKANQPLQIFYFWHKNTEGVKENFEMAKAVNNLAAQYDASRLKIVLVEVSDDTNSDNLTLFIRENQITEPTFQLNNADFSQLSKHLKKELTPLPALVLAQKSEEILFVYNKTMDEKELSAVVSPLVSSN